VQVLLGGESDLLMCNPDSGYNYGITFEKQLLAAGITQQDVNKIKIWNSGYPKEPDKGCCTISQVRNAIQNDDADQQTSGSTSRDMGDQGCVLIEGCAVSVHRAFEVKLFESPNGVQDNDSDFPIRLVLSSFYWYNGSLGIPDGLSDCSKCTITCQGCLGVPYMPAFSATSTGYDSPGYTRVHRDAAIIKAMQSWMHIP
jgi:alpha-amylase